MNKIIFRFMGILGILFLIFNTASCKKDKNDDKDDNKDLLYDDPDATSFRVYFNYLDGRDYVMVNVEKDGYVEETGIPMRDGFVFVGWYKEKNLESLYDFNTPVTKSIMLYAKWQEYEGFQSVMDNYVPESTSTDLEFPQTLEQYKDVYFVWSTSDENTLRSSGLVNPGREDITVTVTLLVRDGSLFTEYKKDCVVKGKTFSKLKEGKATFGYYSTWNFNGYTEKQLKLDVINASFAYVYSDLTLDMRNISNYLSGLMSARQKGVRVVLSIQGYGDASANFSTAARTEANRKQFAANVLEAIETYHFDGVDIDWEYPGYFYNNTNKAAEAEVYTLLMKEIYETVKAKNSDYLVTAALPGGAEGHNRYNLKDVSKYVDFIHLMTYDLEASSKVYHHTAVYTNLGKSTATYASLDGSVELYTLKGVPASKLVAGVAFYGKYTTPASSMPGGLGGDSKASSYKTITYTTIKNNYLSRLGNGVTRYFDSVAKAPYLYDADSNIFITYDDSDSINEKCRYVRNNKLGGVMIWEIGEDQTDDLITAVLIGMKKISA